MTSLYPLTGQLPQSFHVSPSPLPAVSSPPSPRASFLPAPIQIRRLRAPRRSARSRCALLLGSRRDSRWCAPLLPRRRWCAPSLSPCDLSVAVCACVVGASRRLSLRTFLSSLSGDLSSSLLPSPTFALEFLRSLASAVPTEVGSSDRRDSRLAPGLPTLSAFTPSHVSLSLFLVHVV